MNFSPLPMLDLLVRAAAVGQLIMICAVAFYKPLSGRLLSLVGVAACLGAYLALTAPVPDHHYGVLRNADRPVRDFSGTGRAFRGKHPAGRRYQPCQRLLCFPVRPGLWALLVRAASAAPPGGRRGPSSRRRRAGACATQARSTQAQAGRTSPRGRLPPAGPDCRRSGRTAVMPGAPVATVDQ